MSGSREVGARRIIDLLGQRFGKLVVIGRAPHRHNRVAWLCKCDCGGQSESSSLNLRQGRSLACRECCNFRHGHASRTHRSSTYNSWLSMINRCHAPSPPPKAQKYYRAKNIEVCDRWRKFDNFLADMGERQKGKSIDRINGDKGYSPENCRWATRSEQTRNKSPSVIACRRLKEPRP